MSGIPLTELLVTLTKLPSCKDTDCWFSFTNSLGLSTATYLVARFSILCPFTYDTEGSTPTASLVAIPPLAAVKKPPLPASSSKCSLISRV